MRGEQQPADDVQATTAGPHSEAGGTQWGKPISKERAAELRELADRQRAWVGSAPDDKRNIDQSVVKGIRLTGADVFRLAR
jgi:hypothetical protein